MNRVKRLSRVSLLRLELYLELLEQLRSEGRQYVTSKEIGETLGLDAVKVRQDLFGLASAGRPKIGYEVEHLIRVLRDLFDLDREKPACIVGFGNLGRALFGSDMWAKTGYRIAALFDNDPAVIGTEYSGLKVRSIAELFGVVRTEGIEMAVMTVPAHAAQETADLLVAAGIRAIWNFAPARIVTPESVVVENQSLVWGLVSLSQRTKPGRDDETEVFS